MSRGLQAALVVALSCVLGALLVFAAARQGEEVPGGGTVPEQYSVAAEQARLEAERIQQTDRIARTTEPLKIGYVGDSILASGEFASDAARSARAIVGSELGESGALDERIVGFSGAGAGDVLSSMGSELDGAALVVVGLGTNDVGRGVDPVVFEGSYRDVLAQVRTSSPNGVLHCLGTWGNSDSSFALDSVIRDVCTEAGGRFIGLSDLYANLALRGPADVVLASGQRTDGFHPNDMGHDRIAGRILSQLTVEESS